MLLSIAAAVMGAVLVRANMESLFISVLNQAEPNNAIIFKQDTQSEDHSSLPQALIGRLQAASGVSRNGIVATLSPEFVTGTAIELPSGEVTFISVRGVDPPAFAVHQRVHIVRGRAPERGEHAILVGTRLRGRYPWLDEGASIEIGRHQWKIVGVIDALNTPYESEVWADRYALMTELRSESVNIVVARLDPSPDALVKLQHDVEQIREHPLVAASAETFLQQSLGQFVDYRATTTIFTVLLFLGSLFACSSAMYTAVLSRRREIATLIAIGFNRWRIALLLLMESTILAMTGGMLGMLISLGFRGISISYADNRSYPLLITPSVLSGGLTMAVCIGVIGGLVALVQSRRMNLLDSLRG